MPELPEVETVRRALIPKLINKKILSVRILYNGIIEAPTPAMFRERIKNQTFRNITRRGKWLIFELDDYYLLSHLRMEGKFFFKPKSAETSKHEHVIFELEDTTFRYDDTRKFGKMLLIKKDDINSAPPFAKLGLEPFDEGFDTYYLLDKLRGKHIPIKTSLLDQSIVAGIGNIYANEILFLSKINPLTKAGALNIKDIDNIILNSKKVLEEAISLGGSTIHSYSSVDGVDGKFQNCLKVHGRENEKCPVCSGKICKIVVGGRGTYYCPNCQKEK